METHSQINNMHDYVPTETNADIARTRINSENLAEVAEQVYEEREIIDNSLTENALMKNLVQAREHSKENDCNAGDDSGDNSIGEAVNVGSIGDRSGSTHRSTSESVEEASGSYVPGHEKDVSGHEKNNASATCKADDKVDTRVNCDGPPKEFDVNEEGVKKYEDNSGTLCLNAKGQTQKPNLMGEVFSKTSCSVVENEPSEGGTCQMICRNVGKVESLNVPLESDENKADGCRKLGSETGSEGSTDKTDKSEEKVNTCPGSVETGSEKYLDDKDFDSISKKKECELVSGSQSSVHDLGREISDTQEAGQVQDKPVKYKCLKCCRVMKDKRLIENHSCDNELDEEKVNITIMLDTDKKSFVCKECDYSNSGHNFEEHLMCHLMVRPYQCLYCKECFINRKEISRHVLKSHNGAKMSCALRALRKAKALIREVTTSGTISFMAKVAGKVPLEKDPDRKKKIESGQNITKLDEDGQNMTVSDQSHPILTESDESHQNMAELEQSHSIMTGSDQGSKNMTESGQCNKNIFESGRNADTHVQTSENDKMVDSTLINSDQEGGESQQNCNAFSKLREVLTSESSTLTSKVSHEDDIDFSKASEISESEKSCNDSGLKIVASFSLKDMESQDSDSEKVCSEDIIEPNFIMTPLREKEKEPAILSFLGPERPIFKPGDSNCVPMLTPPPLQPAPLHSPNTSQKQVAGSVKQSGTSPNFFICGFNCLFSSMNAVDFREHTVNFHATETYFPCSHCGHRSPNENDLVRHISNHTQTHNKSSYLYVCGNAGCRFGSNMLADYINHIKISHPDIHEPMCYACGDTFPETSRLQTHVEYNVINIVNCPHCPSKATDRKAILSHISSAHPGKPKMVSVAKQLICHDRKINNYEQMVHLQEMLPPTLTPAPVLAASGSVVDQILNRHDLTGDYAKSNSSSLSDILTSRSNFSPRDSPSPVSRVMSPNFGQKEASPESGKSPTSDSSDFGSAKVKEEVDEDAEGSRDLGNESKTAYILDENGVRRRVYIPMSERQAENYRCKHCTFIARDFRRMHCHERSHGMPPTRKERFKCMFCPQGFDSELKFRLHITCHPGLIKFLLYRCKKCEFDTNQRHTIVRHISCNKDQKHRGFGPVEDQYTVVSRSLESRVLECERCDYMTRHKIHMAIHYQRKHNILKDRGEFTVEGITPTDTPLSSYDLSPQDPLLSPSLYSSLIPPGISYDGKFDFTKPSGRGKNSKDLCNPALAVAKITERNELFNKMVSQQAALQQGHVLENLMRKFKCPICKYLLPKAADLKIHVKRHSEIGQITLVMFRCRYCSCMSTARELLYEHLIEKHPGKPIALVKKIVAIDTMEVDKSFAETSMEESLDQLEESLHKEIMSSLNTSGSSLAVNHQEVLSSKGNYEQLFVIPEGGEAFSVPLHCPKCSYSSFNKSEIVIHVSSLHPEVKVIGSDEDVEKLVRATREDMQQQTAASSESEPPKPLHSSQEEVLIVPDDQIFKEPALCSRCDFTTLLRREMVIHLQQNHPEISVMGRNSYPVQVSGMGYLTSPMDESCIVGSGSLDAKLRCLYENYGTQMKCLICGTERPKKFFIHVHILRHLNIYLWKCSFCAHRGLQKYKMVDHIKKIHTGKPLSVRYLRVNVEAKVAQFIEQFSAIKSYKASLDKGLDVRFPSLTNEFSNQTISESSRSRQKSPGPSGNVGCNSPHALGSDELDEKISCLYDNNGGVIYKCIACPNQFQRKFAMHRHIIMSHLKVALLSCAYCSMEGVERHQLVDHILACHRPAPVNILPLDIDLNQRVTDFLTKVAEGELLGSSSKTGSVKFSCQRGLTSYSKTQNMTLFPCNKKQKLGSVKSAKSAGFRFEKGMSGSSLKKSKGPDALMLGRPALDEELSCLYQERSSGQVRCLVCRWEFPRKYLLHRHVMIKHLKMTLVGCPYCPFEGMEKYNVSTHIKEDHGDMPINVRYLQPDIRARVRQFVEDMTNFGGKGQDQNRKRENSSLAVAKVEKRDEEENNVNEEGEKTGDSAPHGGLVVAMFGKKKQSFSIGDVVVKSEVDDDDYKERNNIHRDNGDDEKEQENSYDEAEEGGNSNYDDDDENPGAYKSSNYPSGNSKAFYLKRARIESFDLGSYRSPAGGKPKALDVITKIKVLKSKEGPVVKFYCEKCKFTSLHRSNVVRHIYKLHERYRTHTCPMCTYQTLSLMLMQKHTEKEHPGVPYKEDSFTLNQARSKPKSKPLMGPLSFQKRRQNLLSEKLAQSPPSTTSTNRSSNSSNIGPKHYACAYCHYETNTQEDILKHTRDSHSQGNDYSSGMKSPNIFRNNSNPEDQFLACWDGSKKAVKRRLQNEDEAGVKRKRRFVFEKGNELIQCGHCDTKETSMSRMQDHLTWDHPGLPFQAKRIPAWRFVCKSCAVKTMATSKMKYHLNRHVNYRPYTCLNCGAFFPSPDQCRRHSRSQAHDEQYTYIRNPKKESRVAELLEGTRQLALKVQEEAAKDPDFDISLTDSFIAKFQDARNSVKRSFPVGNAKRVKKSKNATQGNENEGEGTEGEQSKKQSGRSAQAVGVEQDITIKCYNCEFTSGSVSGISIHHNQAHPGQKFLWTELERGFTCDSTGEALPECDSVPSTSTDVGYTTRMTLGLGSNTMRFKCKTCDFSSCVIQAMKSHLKSHQPKGFMCPYCSRSFSGKEKLMRHQYCLHKGQALWVIHLRMAGVAGSTTLKKSKHVTPEDNISNIKTEVTENTDKESGGAGKSLKKVCQSATVFLCSECPYTSESLYHFRLHLAQQHEEFRHKIHGTSVDSPLKCGYCPFFAETEAEFSTHIEIHFNTRNFQCSYCDYSAYDRSSVQRHLASNHSTLNPKILEQGTRDHLKSQDGKDLPLLLNLEPRVLLERISKSVLSQYQYQRSEDGGDTSQEEEDEVNHENSITYDNNGSGQLISSNDKQSIDEDDNERSMLIERVAKVDTIEGRANDNENRRPLDEENENSQVSPVTDSENLAREIRLAEGETSCVLGLDTDMMLMQFGGNVGDNGSILLDENKDDNSVQSEGSGQDSSVNLETSKIQNGSSVIRSKDYTLFAAQESDNQDDNEDEEDEYMIFDNNISLASPLPMISLGDGVAMSPVAMGSVDNEDGNLVGIENQENEADEECVLLLDV